MNANMFFTECPKLKAGLLAAALAVAIWGVGSEAKAGGPMVSPHTHPPVSPHTHSPQSFHSSWDMNYIRQSPNHPWQHVGSGGPIISPHSSGVIGYYRLSPNHPWQNSGTWRSAAEAQQWSQTLRNSGYETFTRGPR